MKANVGSDRHAIVNTAFGGPNDDGGTAGAAQGRNQGRADDREAPNARGQAAEGLAYMFDLVKADSPEFELAVKTLLETLSAPSLEVRYNAIFEIGATKHPPLTPALEALLGDSTPVPGWGDTIGRKPPMRLNG